MSYVLYIHKQTIFHFFSFTHLTKDRCDKNPTTAGTLHSLCLITELGLCDELQPSDYYKHVFPLYMITYRLFSPQHPYTQRQ